MTASVVESGILLSLQLFVSPDDFMLVNPGDSSETSATKQFLGLK